MPISIKPTKRGRESNKTGGRTTTKPEDEGLRVPPEPTYSSDKDPALYDEQQVTRCEIMMAKGVRDPAKLQKLLNLQDRAKVQSYIERVEARWKIGGGEKNIARCRGEQLFLLRALEAEIWRKIEGSNQSTAFDARGRRVENAIGVRELLRLIGRILAISARRAEVQGLTKEAIKNFFAKGKCILVETPCVCASCGGFSLFASREGVGNDGLSALSEARRYPHPRAVEGSSRSGEAGFEGEPCRGRRNPRATTLYSVVLQPEP